MSPLAALGVFIGLSIGLGILFRVPLAFSIGIGAIVTFWLNGIPISGFSSGAFSSVNSFPFLAIPFFIFAGTVMHYSGISGSLLAMVGRLVGGVRGSLGHIVVLGSLGFGALTGSAMATISAIGKIVVPEMLRTGYDKGYIGAILAATCFLGVLIPPSIPGILYAMSSGTSIADVWLSTIPPALMIGVLYMLINHFSVRYLPKTKAVAEVAADQRQRAGIADGLAAILMPVIIFGGIYGGIFTPTEAGAVSAIYGLGYFIVKKYLLRKPLEGTIWLMSKESAILTGAVAIIIVFASLAGRAITLSGVSQQLVDLTTAYVSDPIMFFIAVNILFLILGTFMDANTSILIMTPLMMPTVAHFGIDPLHFGAVILVNLCIGFITPPFAGGIFMACKIVGAPFEAVLSRMWPFLAACLIVLLIITYVPEVVLFLPRMV